MNKEDAVEQLKDLREEKRRDMERDKGDPESIYKKDYDALDFAIKALEKKKGVEY